MAIVWLLGDSSFLAWSSFVTYNLNTAVQIMEEEGFWDKKDVLVLIGVFWQTVMYVLLYSLAVPLDIMLLVAAINRRPRLLHGWLVAYAVVYILFLLLNAPNIIMGFAYRPYYALGVAAVFLVHGGLTLYFWIVVRSYYQQLSPPNGEAGPRLQPTAGNVYRRLPAGEVLPGLTIYCEGGGVAMQPTEPPRYTSSA